MDIEVKVMKLIPPAPLRAYKTGFNHTIFHFNILGNLSIIRCDK